MPCYGVKCKYHLVQCLFFSARNAVSEARLQLNSPNLATQVRRAFGSETTSVLPTFKPTSGVYPRARSGRRPGGRKIHESRPQRVVLVKQGELPMSVCASYIIGEGLIDISTSDSWPVVQNRLVQVLENLNYNGPKVQIKTSAQWHSLTSAHWQVFNVPVHVQLLQCDSLYRYIWSNNATSLVSQVALKACYSGSVCNTCVLHFCWYLHSCWTYL